MKSNSENSLLEVFVLVLTLLSVKTNFVRLILLSDKFHLTPNRKGLFQTYMKARKGHIVRAPLYFTKMSRVMFMRLSMLHVSMSTAMT